VNLSLILIGQKVSFLHLFFSVRCLILLQALACGAHLRLAPACARAGLESRRRPPAPALAWRAAAAEKRIELVGFVFGAESVVWSGCLIILSTGAIRSIRKNSMHATPAGGPKGVAYVHNGNYQQLQQL